MASNLFLIVGLAQSVSWPLGLAAFIALMYKIYLENKVRKPDDPPNLLTILAFRKYDLRSFFPMDTSAAASEEERILRVRANRSLAVFYVCIIGVVVIVNIWG